MQKDGKKVSITISIEEKITIDHRTTKSRNTQTEDIDTYERFMTEDSDQESEFDDLNEKEGPDT